jgi:hypothetical protein
VFALGSSAVWIAGDFWDLAAAAARQLGRRAILVTGPATPKGLPGGVRAFPYLPYSSAFPRAAAVVHQAGIGTLAQALRAGRPQLIVPVAFDQPDNAQRAAPNAWASPAPFPSGERASRRCSRPSPHCSASLATPRGRRPGEDAARGGAEAAELICP